MHRGTTRPISVAPMMDRTDRHQRFLMRRITRHTLLYTEMVTANAVLHGDRARLLAYDPSEHPVALQLGGDDPAALATCARIAEDLGYDEVNLNVGCPSDRVQQGSFGACLMLRPERVAACVAAMRAAVGVPVTVKHRIGVDDVDTYEDMLRFVDTIEADRFTVHARKAWLSGLSPKENREVPPLRHDDVHRLKRDRPDLVVEINGGITSLDAAAAHLAHVDAVMIGRAAWEQPWMFADADRRFFGATAAAPSREAVIAAFTPYAARATASGATPTAVLKPLLTLFAGEPGTRAFKRALTEGLAARRPVGDVLRRALDAAYSKQTPGRAPQVPSQVPETH